VNSYSYGGDNPITKKDPSGLSLWEPVFIAGEGVEQVQYAFNLGKYANMTPQQRVEEAPKMDFESLTTLPGLFVFGSTIGTQLMLANFALQGIDYVCSNLTTCRAWGSASNGMTPQQIAQQVISSLGPTSPVTSSGGQSTNIQNFGSLNGLYSNIYSSSIQARIDTAKSFNSSSGNSSSGSGGGVPSNNSLWITPSGAVVTFGGQLVAPPPRKN